MSVLKFSGEHVSDQKRIARAEQLLQARTLLRARDGVHNRAWRVLMMAGGAPHGEIKAIRELMPKASIVAVDNNSRCLELAIEAGADDVAQCDVLEMDRAGARTAAANGVVYGGKVVPPKALLSLGKFDLFHLDLCGVVTRRLATALSAYLRQMVTGGGVMIVTFSYGRDVAEQYIGLGRTFWVRTSQLREPEPRVLPDAMPDSVAGRVMFLTGRAASTTGWLRSVVAYKGAEMPMCSCLFHYGRVQDTVSFVKVEPGDFELAVSYPDAVNLYDCPRDRIESFRRRFAAIKAAITRKDAVGA